MRRDAGVAAHMHFGSTLPLADPPGEPSMQQGLPGVGEPLIAIMDVCECSGKCRLRRIGAAA